MLRFFSLGRSEAEWWNSHVFSVPFPPHTPNPRVSPYFHLIPPRFVPRAHVPTITKNLRNPGFYDPWSSDDVTLRSYANLYSGKLDWVLVRGLEVTRWERLNTELNASDHMLLVATVALPEPAGGPLVPLGGGKFGILGKDAWVARDPARREENSFVQFSRRVRPLLTVFSLATAASLMYWRYTRRR